MVYRFALDSLVQQLAATDRAYAAADERLVGYGEYAPNWVGMDAAIEARRQVPVDRKRLYAMAASGYEQVITGEAVRNNLEKLQLERTFVVTTAHQPCLVGGPLYFIYKALSVISLCRALRGRYPHLEFVPVYWLGSEDHDFEEINHFGVLGQVYEWAKPNGGATGQLSVSTVKPILDALEGALGRFEQEAVGDLMELLRYAYSADCLEVATIRLLNGLLGHYGLVVFSGNSALGKTALVSVMADDLLNHTAHRLVNTTIDSLEQMGFKGQARPREINIFYMQAGSRERIVQGTGDTFEVLNSSKRWVSWGELYSELEHSPELFSPNVILRPLYQELLLPSVAYVGGGGELAYWLERKSLFRHYQIPMPVLVRRHSALLIDRHTVQKMEKLSLEISAIWLDNDSLTKQYIARQAPETTDFSVETGLIQTLERLLADKALKTDPSLEKAVYAELNKVRNSVEQLTAKIVKAEKRKNETTLQQLIGIKGKLFPNGKLQERTDSFIEYFLSYGGDHALWDTLLEAMQPLAPEMLVITSEV